MNKDLRIVMAPNGVQVYIQEFFQKDWVIAKVFYNVDKATNYIKRNK